MNKPPAFQFYARDFLVDAAVRLMSLEERGAYITLLAHAWIEGGIPADRAKLARLCGVTGVDMERIWPALESCWVPTRRESLTNPRMEHERKSLGKYLRGKQKAGILSGISRRAKGLGGEHTANEPRTKPNPALASASASAGKSKSAAAPPERETAGNGQRGSPGNPMAILGPLIRQHLYIHDGQPPDGWDPRRCADICQKLLRQRYSVDDLRDALAMVPVVRAGGARCDESFTRWFAKQGKLTMRVLNDRWGSGSVLEQLLHLARKAEGRRPTNVPREILGAL